MGLGWVPAYGASLPTLFQEVTPPLSVHANAIAKREHFVQVQQEQMERLSPDLFKTGHKPLLHLNLFAEVDYQMVLDHSRKRPGGRQVFSGHLQGVPGSIGVLTYG